MRTKILFLTVILTVSAYAGDQGGGGGDPTASSFHEIATESVRLVEKYNYLFPEINIEKLRIALNTVPIIAKDQVYILVGSEQVEVPAANHPNAFLIEVSRSRFPNLARKEAQIICLHELLGLLKLESPSNYAVSNRLRSLKKNYQFSNILGAWSSTETDSQTIWLFEKYSEDQLKLTLCNKAQWNSHRTCVVSYDDARRRSAEYLVSYNSQIDGFCSPYIGAAKTASCGHGYRVSDGNHETGWQIIDALGEFGSKIVFSGQMFQLIKVY